MIMFSRFSKCERLPLPGSRSHASVCLHAPNSRVPKLECKNTKNKKRNGWNQEQLIILNSPSGIRPDLTPLTPGGSSLISISLCEADTFLSVVRWMQNAWCFCEGFGSFHLNRSHVALLNYAEEKKDKKKKTDGGKTKLSCSGESWVTGGFSCSVWITEVMLTLVDLLVLPACVAVDQPVRISEQWLQSASRH